jgi:hypothetical protein
MRHGKTWVGLVISAVIVYLAFRKIDLHQPLENLQKANYFYLIPIVAALALLSVGSLPSCRAFVREPRIPLDRKD